MAKFIIDAPEGVTGCQNCPFNNMTNNICLYLSENNYCEQYDFSQINIEEYNENNN